MVESRVSQVFQSVQQERGFIDPLLAAQALAGPNVSLQQKIAQEILFHPTSDYLYEGSRGILQTFLSYGDHVTIWTDDYHWRVATSGLADLQKELPQNENYRFSVVHGEDKMSLLPIVFENVRNHGISDAIIADNKKENLEQAVRMIRSAGRGIHVNLVWINPNAPEITLPMSIAPEIPLISMPSVRELANLRSEKGSSPHAMIVDFNHTLVNTPNYLDGVQRVVSQTLRTSNFTL